MRLSMMSSQKALMFGAVLGGLYFFMLFDSGAELENQIATVQASVQEQEAKAQESDAAIAEVEQVRATIGALSEQFKTVSQALPSDIPMSEIIRTVDNVARASGVAIKMKEPRPIVNREFYEEIPLFVTMEGSYSELTLFLYYLAGTARIMKINDFILSYPPNVRSNSNKLYLEGTVVSYRFINQPANAGAASGTAGP